MLLYTKKILLELKKNYPKAKIALDFESPFQLLTATILSAQCTDKRVNLVTPALFKRFPTAQAMAKASLPEVEKLIHSTGFFRQKAKSLVLSARDLTEKFNGQVPKTMEELLSLRGVARKTANVLLGTAFGIASGVVVDTHVIRLSHRMGFSEQENPDKIEKDLMKIVPQRDWIWFSHAIITHGRQVCKAQKPACAACVLISFCPKKGV